MAKTINPYNPVYISYAWGDDIEQDVDRICEIMRENGIEYKRDKEGLCDYRANIDEIEKKIGDGDAVIVVVSKKYLQSLHTMNEWHNIVTKGDIANRVFIIILEDAGITDYNNYVKYRDNLKQEYEKCEKKHNECRLKRVTPGVVMPKVEINAYMHEGFVSDLDVMFGYCRNYNRGASIEGKRENNFQDVIEPLKKYVKVLADITNAKKTIKSLKSKIKILENQLKDSNAEKLQLINEIEEKDKEISSLLVKLEESKKIEHPHQEGEVTTIFDEITEEKLRREQADYDILDKSNFNAIQMYLRKYSDSCT